jgi:hypothetical protein
MAITLVRMATDKNIFFTIIYTSCLIICASLKEICLILNEELIPQDFIIEINKGPLLWCKWLQEKIFSLESSTHPA